MLSGWRGGAAASPVGGRGTCSRPFAVSRLTGWAAQAGNRHLVLQSSELKASTREGTLCLSAAEATGEKTHHLARLKEAMGTRSQASWGGATCPWVAHVA